MATKAFEVLPSARLCRYGDLLAMATLGGFCDGSLAYWTSKLINSVYHLTSSMVWAKWAGRWFQLV